MTETSTLAPVASISRVRRIVGVLRLAASATLLVAIGYQIIDKVTHNDMVPGEYFMYFTIQSTIIAIVVLFVSGMTALRHPADSTPVATARLAVLSYAVVTATVYNIVLRGLPPEGYQAVPWPGEIMHVWIPIVLLIDWLASPGRPALPWKALGFAVIYPLAWLGVTLIRGALDAWYPYPFLEPETGWGSVFAYIVAITAFILVVSTLAILYSRRLAPRHP